jgi:hypothetical protein
MCGGLEQVLQGVPGVAQDCVPTRPVYRNEVRGADVSASATGTLGNTRVWEAADFRRRSKRDCPARRFVEEEIGRLTPIMKAIGPKLGWRA